MVYFQTKSPNLGKFLEGLGMEKVGVFNGHLKYIMAVWYILMAIWYTLWPFGIIFHVLVYCVKKNLATLLRKA
jgi:hypothetical protein